MCYLDSGHDGGRQRRHHGGVWLNFRGLQLFALGLVLETETLL